MPETVDLFKSRNSDDTAYDEHLIEQYKLYVDTTDRVATRRLAAATFFATMNTAFVSYIATTWAKDANVPLRLAMIAMAIAGLTVCVVWYRLVQSYRQLNFGKFQVLRNLEERMPLRLYASEWQVLGEGKDPIKYQPFTQVESAVPKVFGLLYILMALVLVGSLLGPLLGI